MDLAFFFLGSFDDLRILTRQGRRSRSGEMGEREKTG
jgi:hypothetical protein